MHFSQKDLFWGMDIEFVKTVTDIAVHISYKQGEKLFDTGDSADHFYVLLKGSVTMERGKDQLHTAKQAGEIFGWSALIRRKDFAASATCSTDSEILKIARDPFLNALAESPQNKATLFEHLAKKLGNQLLEVYISGTC
jgi:CRP/FNR family transcriptional regulator, anaerobic regulatory protein